MTAEAGEFAGHDGRRARAAVLERLEEEGLFVKAEDYNHAVGTCYRCGTTIEPLLSLQWFMDMKRLAQPAIAAVEDGRVRFVPGALGRRVPRLDAGHPALVHQPAAVVGAPHPRLLLRASASTSWWRPTRAGGVREVRRARCGTRKTCSTPGSAPPCGRSPLWAGPRRPTQLKAFYPTTVLSTARDIIYLWVARMIMMGLEFMGDVPFRDVIIHPTVLAADGRRMSKSLGTGVDPLELIADYGADATRFGLAYMSSVQDVRFSAERIEMGRNFANKIWNASRLVLQGAHPAG